MFVVMTDLPPMPSQFGTVHTMVRGNQPVTFEMQILARLAGGGPSGTDAILGRASGRVMEELGGIAQGMSGSPVMVGGQVIGAVAFGFANDLTLALITPLSEMLKVQPATHGNASEPGLEPPGPPLIQPSLPLSYGGFRSSRAVQYLERRLERNMAPGFSSPVEPEEPELALQPGGAVAAALMIGDVQIGSIGTVTAMDGDLVWAFGHPFLFLGPVELPMMTADILETTRGHPPHAPVRLGRMRKLVGAVLEDRPVAIVGRLGVVPSLVPVTITISDADTEAQTTLHVQVVRHGALLADLVVAAGLEACARGLGRLGGGTAAVSLTVRSAALRRPLAREETIFSDDDIAMDALRPLVEILRTMARERLPVDEVTCACRVDLRRRTALLRAALPEKEGIGHLGEGFTIGVEIQPHGGTPERMAITMAIPPDFPVGMAQLRVIPGRQLQMPLAGARSAAEVEAAVAGRPAEHDLVVALIPAAPGGLPVVRSFRTAWALEGEQLALPILIKTPWP